MDCSFYADGNEPKANAAALKFRFERRELLGRVTERGLVLANRALVRLDGALGGTGGRHQLGIRAHPQRSHDSLEPSGGYVVSAASVCATRRPNRSSGVSAVGSTNVVNSTARPAGSLR
jgi:hypothetical protein